MHVIALTISWEAYPPKNAHSGGKVPSQVYENNLTNLSFSGVNSPASDALYNYMKAAASSLLHCPGRIF